MAGEIADAAEVAMWHATDASAAVAAAVAAAGAAAAAQFVLSAHVGSPALELKFGLASDV